MNKKNELRSLFHKYINRKERESSIPYSHNYGYNNNYGTCGIPRTPPMYNNPNTSSTTPTRVMTRENFTSTIYFYEWSDITKEPRKFFMLDIFDNFLKTSGIYLALFQKDIIKNLKWCYITCKKGTKDLIIRSTYSSLSDALKEESDKSQVHSIGFTAMKPSVGNDNEKKNDEPYQVAITRSPMVSNNGLDNGTVRTPKIISQKVFEPEGRWFG